MTAEAGRTSVALILDQQVPFDVGDNAVILQAIDEQRPDTARIGRTDTAYASERIGPLVPRERTAAENIVSGRAAFQFTEIVAADSRYNLFQPSLLFRLNIDNLIGSGMQFSLDDNSYYDRTNSYTQYGNDAGMVHRLYEYRCAGNSRTRRLDLRLDG